MADLPDGAIPSLAVPRRRLEWADHHLDLLQTALAEYRQLEPHEVSLEREEDDWFVYRLEVRLEPPDEISLTFGDWLHNVRSALDNLIRPLVMLAGNTPRGRQNFPIFTSERSFERAGRNRINGVLASTRQ